MGRPQQQGNYTKVVDEDDVEADVVVVPPIKPWKKEQQQRKPKSCCFWFCLVLLGLIGLFVLLFTITATGGYFWIRHQVKRFTVTTPLDLPIHYLPQAELDVVKDRSKLFVDIIRAGGVPEKDLTVTADELNGFIAHSDFMRGNAFVTIDENDFMKADFSIPMHGLPGGEGRYFVASGSVDVSYENDDDDEPYENNGVMVTTKFDTLSPIKDLNGPLFLANLLMYWDEPSTNPNYAHELVINLKGGQFMGNVAPEDFIAKKKNLVEDIYDDDHHHHHHDHHHHHHHHHDDDDDDDEDCDPAAFLDGIESVSIQNGAITIHARRDGKPDKIIPAVSKKSHSSSWVEHGTRKLRALSKLLS
ncbi:hypothetical protein ACA910_006797 [Epithemia clementina (nom. ined.)]